MGFREVIQIRAKGKIGCVYAPQAALYTQRASGFDHKVGRLSAAGTRLDRYLRASDVANVNVHYPSLTALQFILVRLFFQPDLKIILSFHGLDLTHSLQSKGLERLMWRLLLRWADAVVSCSDAQKNRS